MESEDSIIRAFLEGPLSRADAIDRLMGLELSNEDAHRLLDEAVEAYEADNSQFGVGA